MPFDPNVLANNLEKMTPTDSETSAISAFSDAWSAYFAGSTASGAPAVPGSYQAGIAAMKTAMIGMSAVDAGAMAIQEGIAAFWKGIQPSATVIWITAPVVLVPPIVPPPSISTIALQLTATFKANVDAKLSLHDAAVKIASVLHTNGGLGGTVPGSVPPSPPAPLPIL